MSLAPGSMVFYRKNGAGASAGTIGELWFSECEQVGVALMMNRQTFITGAAILTSLIGGSASADELKSVRIQDMTVSSRLVEPNIEGVFQDGEYAGVRFSAVPDDSIPLPPEHRPEALLAKLDPDLKVESVGSPPFNGRKSQAEILAALPRTAYRLDSLFSADGTRAYRLGEPPITVYVTGYKTSPGYTPGLDELKEGRPLKENRVYISAYNVSFGNLPPCSVTRQCTPPADR